jgi:transcription initiation factor TFIIB
VISFNSSAEYERYKQEIRQRNFADERHDVCPYCNSTNIIIDHQKAEVSCASCGSVLDESQMDLGPEWNAYDKEQRDKRARVGAPLTNTISDRGLVTTIDWRDKDIYGRNIPESNKAQIHRLRKWNKRLRISGAGERNLAFALSELDRESSSLGIPRSVREDAAVIYRSAAKKNLIRGRSIEGVVAACVYTACRRCNIPRTLDEVSEVSRISKKQIGKTYRFLARELKIKLRPTSPIDYISRFGSKLGLSGEAQSKAVQIIKQSIENGLSSGKGPTGIAAAALYIASVLLGEKKTQRQVAEIAGVTEVTIRNRSKELSEHMNIVI